MKNKKNILFIFLFSLISLSACIKQDNNDTIDAELQEIEEKQKARERFLTEYKLKHNAIDYYNDFENCDFSVERVDKCKDKNVFAEINIRDIFYEDNNIYLYCEDEGMEDIVLEINSEQYSKIKSLSSNDDNDLYAIFNLDTVIPMCPTIDANFYLDVSVDSYEYGGTDFDYDLSMHSRLTRGTLVDIVGF